MVDMKTHPLGIAARYNDADVEEHSFAETIGRQGLTLEDVMHIAEQRAIRALYVELGRDMSIFKQREPQRMQFTGEERDRLIILQAAVIDGILIGWRGRSLKDGA